MPPRGKTTTGSPGTKSTALRRSAAAVRSIEPGYASALLEYAAILHKGGLGGKDASRPEAVAAKIEVGRDLGLPPTQAVANVMIVNGKPTLWGDAALALIRSSGLLESIEESFEGEPSPDDSGRPTNRDYTAVFTVKRTGTESSRTAKFSVQDAIRAGLWGKSGPWQTYPERMLMWRAKGFACRDEFQDVLCGCIFTEEAMDLPGATVRTAEVIDVQTTSPGQPSEATATPVTTTTEEEGSAKDGSSPAAGFDAGPILQSQLETLAEFRQSEMTFRSISNDDDDAQRAAWLEVLHPYRVTTARDLSCTQAADLIEQLRKKHDFPTGPGFGPAKK
jgi:hypothetical protein